MKSTPLKTLLKPLFTIVCRIPVIGRIADRFIEKRKITSQFSNELLFLNGKLEPVCTHQSVMFFTVHKSASVYVGNILKRLTADVGMTSVDLENYFFTTGDSEERTHSVHWEKTQKGYFFGPFRYFNPMLPDTNDYKVVVKIRDPRDVLTSLYFSHAYSHFIPAGTSRTRKSMETIRKMPWKRRSTNMFYKKRRSICTATDNT